MFVLLFVWLFVCCGVDQDATGQARLKNALAAYQTRPAAEVITPFSSSVFFLFGIFHSFASLSLCVSLPF